MRVNLTPAVSRNNFTKNNASTKQNTSFGQALPAWVDQFTRRPFSIQHFRIKVGVGAISAQDGLDTALKFKATPKAQTLDKSYLAMLQEVIDLSTNLLPAKISK